MPSQFGSGIFALWDRIFLEAEVGYERNESLAGKLGWKQSKNYPLILLVVENVK